LNYTVSKRSFLFIAIEKGFSTTDSIQQEKPVRLGCKQRREEILRQRAQRTQKGAGERIF
jgi:hypothetical protein